MKTHFTLFNILNNLFPNSYIRDFVLVDKPSWVIFLPMTIMNGYTTCITNTKV